ncbi:unnamed protein product [Vicia faba]|uniref:Uncharacterized protein n=1 Tax=Vicia faba TaxID=3906 RepID=A0AAV1AAB3_VICFA|nr:unnamed protein product [Vicia faba]
MAMAVIASITSINTTHNHHTSLIFPPKQHPHLNKTRIHRFRCNGTNQKQESQPQNNAFLKVAWYSSELLGIAASVFRSSPDQEEASPRRVLETVDRVSVVDTIKQDFQRSYFVTGDLTLNAYEEDCEFADPAGGKILRIKESVTGDSAASCPFLGGLFFLQLDTQNIILMQNQEKHVEHWNVPKMALFKQILRPSKGFGLKDYVTKWLKIVQVNR